MSSKRTLPFVEKLLERALNKTARAIVMHESKHVEQMRDRKLQMRRLKDKSKYMLYGGVPSALASGGLFYFESGGDIIYGIQKVYS